MTAMQHVKCKLSRGRNGTAVHVQRFVQVNWRAEAGLQSTLALCGVTEDVSAAIGSIAAAYKRICTQQINFGTVLKGLRQQVCETTAVRLLRFQNGA